jgi:hypothetical protein
MLYFGLDCIVEIGVVHWRRGGLFFAFEVNYFYLLPESSFGIATLDFLLIGSRTRQILLLLLLKEYPPLLRQHICSLLLQQSLVKLI